MGDRECGRWGEEVWGIGGWGDFILDTLVLHLLAG